MDWGSELSIYAKVSAEYDELFSTHNDDHDTSPIFDRLSDDEVQTWLAECALEDELRPEHGMKPNFYDILEHEIYARGIEKR